MSVGSIQFGGLASGLDTNAIIAAILGVEARPIGLFQSQRTTEQNRISLFNSLEGLVEALQAKAQALTSSGSLFVHSVTPGTEGIATFTVTGDVPSGGHTLNVISLAAADRYAFAGTADTTTDLGAGSVDFSYDGTSYSVAIDGAASSLDEIAATINTAADGDVTASVVNAGTETSPSYQLVLAGNDTGADFAIGSLTSSVAGLTGATRITTAANAVAEVDGLSISRSDNEFSGVIEGLSFTAQSTGSTTFNVAIDVEASREGFQGLVDAYNEVIEFINAQNKYDPDAGAGGDLFGDAALTSVHSAIRNALFSVDLADVVSDTEGYSTLGLIGIDVQNDGTLKIDEDTFEEKLTNNSEAFETLFADDTDGVFVRLDAAIDGLLESTTNANGFVIDGVFDRRRDTLNNIVGDLDDEIERLERNLESLEASLVQKFANLEQLLAGLNAQSAFLASNLAFPQGN